MPRTKRPAALTAQPSTKCLDDLTQEERKKYDSLLEDFDRQWEMLFTNMDKADEAFFKELEMLGKVAALSIPKAERKAPYCDWAPSFYPDKAAAASSQGKQQDDEVDAMDKVMEEVSQEVSRQVNAAKQNIKSARKRAPRTIGKTPSQNNSMLPPASGTVRRSTRKRTARNLDMETPLSSTTAMKRAPFATPAITPKFDITTPLHRSMMRLARPDETLVSLSGSPVYAPPSTQKRGRGGKKETSTELLPIPLGNGRNLMVPLGNPAGGPLTSTAKKGAGRNKTGRSTTSSSAASSSSSTAATASLDLDETELQKLHDIRSKIDSMINSAKH